MDGFHFTMRVRAAVSRAREESARMHYAYVGTEQILLGLIADEESIAADLLKAQAIDLARVRAEVAREAKPEPEHEAGPDIPYSARAKRVLELAMTEAREEGYGFVDTGHLLIALAREKRDLGARVLNTLGFSRDEARTKLRELHAQGGELGGLAPVDTLAPDQAAKLIERIADTERYAPVFKAHGIDVPRLVADIRKTK